MATSRNQTEIPVNNEMSKELSHTAGGNETTSAITEFNLDVSGGN